MTAAATTGPARHPLPTSSTPATRRKPARCSSRSWRMCASRIFLRRAGRRGLTGPARIPVTGSVGSALAERGGLADPIAKEVELCSSSDTVADHLDLVDARCMHHEGALDADAAGDAANGDGLVQAAAAHPHHGALEDLNPLAASFDHLHRDADRVAGGDLRDVGAELLALELLDGVHGRSDLVIAGLPASYQW